MNPNSERRFHAAEVRLAERDGQRVLTGYAAVFNKRSVDLGGFREVIAPGAFDAALSECDIRCLVDHDSRLILGKTRSGTLKLEADQVGLRFEVPLADTQAGRDVAINVARGDIDGCSFSFVTLPDGESWAMAEDGQVVRTLKRVHLFDVGPVTFPAYTDTSCALRSLALFQASRQAPPTDPQTDTLGLDVLGVLRAEFDAIELQSARSELEQLGSPAPLV